jgi:predicted phosphohydrolase
MSLFAIGDLHLSFSSNKPMDIFGGWDNYTERMTYNWNRNVAPDDTVVLPGDFSWAMNFDEAKADFDYVNKLNGKKILLKGNHDYWWTTLNKMNRFLSENSFDKISILHNNHFRYEQYGICGTRGWINENGNTADAKVLAREAQRLEVSIKSALSAGLIPIVFLHYPPVYADSCNYNMLEILFKYNIKECYYGHIHGKSCNYAINGECDGIKYKLVSSDYVQFNPVLIK